MRRKILIAVTAVILLLLFFMGFLEYRQYSSYKIPIHADVKSIIKLNTDAFIKSFIREYGYDFRKKLSRSAKKEEDREPNTGIYLPGNIFIYTLKTKQPSTIFCAIPLNDVNDFKKFATARLGIIFNDAKPESPGTGYDGKLTILCSNEYAAFAYSEQKEETLNILKDLVNKVNLAATSSKLIKELKQDRSHIAYSSDNGVGSIKFTGDKILLHATLMVPDDLHIPSQSIKRKMESPFYAAFFVNMKPPASFFKKTYSIKEHSVEADSLLQYFNGYSDIKVSDFINQSDTVTTYEYDDNFEKKEKRTITKVKVPRIEIAMQAGQLFLKYLQKQEIVTTTQKINREVFPLYQLTVNQKDETIFLNTADEPAGKREFENTPNFMEMNIDVQRLQSLFDSTSLKKYVKGMESIYITGNKSNETQITIDGSIKFEAGALKTVVELIKSLH